MLSFGNPLHSTALEEDLSPNLGEKTEAPKTLARKKGAKASEENRRETPLTPGHARKGRTSGGVQPPSRSSAQKRSQPRAQRKSFGGKSKTRPLQRVSEGMEVEETTGLRSASADPGSEDSDSAGPVAQGPAPKQPRATPKKAKAPAVLKKTLPTHSEGSATSLSQETSPSQSTVTEAGEGSSKTAASVQRRRLSSLSSEELSGEDPSWHAEPRKKTFGTDHLGKRQKSTSRSSGAQKRKSSSGSPGNSPGPARLLQLA
ncbi:uncharacterized protein LOC118793613 [Megalops cyprinoides]|uniref:uncharacterized protein LOC118793613 n=1 Tax=Megalops cyprinoides TaxID=118141 RepID=UPI00186514D6|nr:uncharacterized protein LOC118793613 [Megalops cyprinoides]